MIWQQQKFTVAGISRYKETDNINSEQSSMKSHPLWVTQYVFNSKVKGLEVRQVLLFSFFVNNFKKYIFPL